MLESSPVIVSDPGMTNANMRLVIVSVTLEDKMETPQAHPDAGEFIVTRVVELSQVRQSVCACLYRLEYGFQLSNELKGEELSVHDDLNDSNSIHTAYDTKVKLMLDNYN